MKMHPLKGRKKTEEHKRKIALAHLGMKSTDVSKEKNRLAKLGKRMSPSTEFKKGQVSLRKGTKQPQTPEHYAKRVALLPRGTTHYNWKGGITPVNEAIRRSIEYKLWRKSVWERDHYMCIWCGSKKNIQADHIKRFSEYPELRFAIDNGRTLCVECHRKTDTWGRTGLKGKVGTQ